MINTKHKMFFLSFFSIAIITTSLGVLVNELITASYITISQAGTIVSARSLGYLIGAFASTKLFYKINYSKILPIYFLAISILLLLFLNFNSSLMTYIIIFLLFGMLKNLVTVGGNQLMSLTFIKGANNNIINYVQALYGLGTFVSPLLSGYIVTKFNISILYVIFLSLSLGVSLYFAFSLNKINFSIKKKTQLDSESSFRNISLLIIFFALYASCEIFIGTWGPFLLTNNGVSKNIVYLSNALFWISLAGSKIILIPLTNKLKNIKVIVLSIIISIASILMLLIENNNAFSLITMISLGLSMGNIVPTVMKYITINKKVTSADTAWCFVGAGVGGVLSSKLFGIILQINPKATILFCVGCFFCLLVVFYFLTKSKRSFITLKV